MLAECRKVVSIKEIRRQAGEGARKLSGWLGSRQVLRVFTAVLILVAGVTALCWVLSAHRYAAETKLLFFCQDPQDTGGLSLEREVELLRDFDFVKTLARDMHIVPPEGTSKRSGESRTHTALADRKAEGRQTDPWKRVSPPDFNNWVAKNLAVDAQVSGSMAKVTLRLKGEDPEYLKAVLDGYVPRYAEYRRNLPIRHAERPQQEGPRRESTADQRALAAISDQLQRIEIQRNGCELALQLIDSGAGVFSGFVPENAMTGTASLASFQEKIIQLAIKKKALEVKFLPGSREIRAIQLEIEGVKSAMRECIAAHLEFLQKGKAQLLAQQKALGHRAGTVSLGIDLDAPGRFGRSQSNEDSWFLLQDGLYLLRDRPSITRTPVLARARNLKEAVAAYVWASPGRNEDERQAQRTANSFPSVHKHPWPQEPATTSTGDKRGGDLKTAVNPRSGRTALKDSSAGREANPRVINFWSHSLW